MPPNRDYVRHFNGFQELIAAEGILDWTQMARLETTLRECTKGPGVYQDMGYELLNLIQKLAPAKYDHLRSVAASHNFFSCLPAKPLRCEILEGEIEGSA